MVCDTCGDRMEKLKKFLEEKCNAMNRSAGSMAIAEFATAREALIHAGMTRPEVEAFIEEVSQRRRSIS